MYQVPGMVEGGRHLDHPGRQLGHPVVQGLQHQADSLLPQQMVSPVKAEVVVKAEWLYSFSTLIKH